MTRALPVLLVAVLLAAGGALVYRQTGPRLEFTNRLAAPVTLALEGEAPRTVAPGATIRIRVPRNRTVVGQWTMVQPLSADRQPMGEVVQGTVLIRGPGGIIRARAESRGPSGDFFAPLITNATAAQLRIRVNAGLVGGRDCGCAVRSGARRVFIGYYRLYRNSSVEARRSDRMPARFQNLGPEVRAASGAVGLAFNERDFPGS